MPLTKETGVIWGITDTMANAALWHQPGLFLLLGTHLPLLFCPFFWGEAQAVAPLPLHSVFSALSVKSEMALLHPPLRGCVTFHCCACLRCSLWKALHLERWPPHLLPSSCKLTWRRNVRVRWHFSWATRAGASLEGSPHATTRFKVDTLGSLTQHRGLQRKVPPS